MNQLCASAGSASRGTPGRIALCGALTLILGACSAPSSTGRQARRPPSPSVGVSVETQPESSRVPAIINGQVVSWAELRDRTSEIAGAVALEELALDRALEREMLRTGTSLDPGAITRERDLLLDELSPSGDLAASAQILEIVRRQRALGSVGFEGLLQRNARLRALASPGVRVEQREVDLSAQIRFGPRKLARIIVAPSEREAAALRREILALPGDRLDAFTARASTRSIDASGARGGQIGSVSPVDPAFPDSIRRALDSLGQGQLSSVLAIDGGFAILMVERDMPVETPSAAQRAQIERELLRRKQRLEMDRLADRLLDQTSVSVLDPSLAWSWEGRGGGR